MTSCPNPPTPCGYSYLYRDGCNFNTLYGAMVGGPDASDNFVDKRSDYVSNEVAIDYNAGYTGAFPRAAN